MEATPDDHPVWVTSADGTAEHAVPDTAMAAGQELEAVCGARFLPAAMTAPPGRTCEECLTYLLVPAPREPEPRRLWRRYVAKH
ncbi:MULTISPECIES: hypothetical protein [Amycolatopsis]|uniref:Uncharacterized protein n=1 Tax=Amycolatopsis thermoflava TaxID=84480 RepID=A0A3N2GXX2_9PSEU|nr:hypothetical protein [Amycolatopsis thermoflava]ROS41417.1 hypothetical protein EDD35_3774 [Amycolatopsis thermoflava]